MTPSLLRHLSGESIGRFPVWFMRQAGRYLPSYQAIRSKHSFWEMVTQPDVAAEVTLLPLKEFELDAAIIFSDILTPVFGMGIPIEMREGVGPVIKKPFEGQGDFENLLSFEPKTHVAFLGAALRNVRSQLDKSKALIGFAGAPWTVASYLVARPGKNKFQVLQKWAYENPDTLVQSLRALGEMTKRYLAFQIESGADIFQLFDTWLSEMPREFFPRYKLLLEDIFQETQKKKIPSIYFSKCPERLSDLTGLPVDVLSVGSEIPLLKAEELTGKGYSLQGNLDPTLLQCRPEVVRLQTRLLVEDARSLSHPPILNLGHGVMPEAQLESVRAFVAEARSLWI